MVNAQSHASVERRVDGTDQPIGLVSALLVIFSDSYELQMSGFKTGTVLSSLFA